MSSKIIVDQVSEFIFKVNKEESTNYTDQAIYLTTEQALYLLNSRKQRGLDIAIKLLNGKVLD